MRDYRREPFAEEALPASVIAASETTGVQFEANRDALPGQIGHVADVAAVNASRSDVTERALRLEPSGSHNQRDRVLS